MKNHGLTKGSVLKTLVIDTVACSLSMKQPKKESDPLKSWPQKGETDEKI